jgi:hypothetical protein
MDAEQCVRDTCTRWRDAVGRPRDDTDLTMSRLNMAVNQLAHRGQWGSVRPLFETAQDFLLTLANVARNAAMAPGPELTTELGKKLGEAYSAVAQAHNSVVDVLYSIDHQRSRT